MTQRIFDIENEKDYADLWDILPEETNKIAFNDGIYYLYDKNDLCIAKIYSDLIKINWHAKKEIIRHVNYKDMVGCVGWFWDSRENALLGRLVEYYNGDDFPFGSGDNCYKNFRPAKKSELKFWEDEE